MAKLANRIDNAKAENKPGKRVSFSAKPQKNIPAIMIAAKPAKAANIAAKRSIGRPFLIGCTVSGLLVTDITGSESINYTCRGE